MSEPEKTTDETTVPQPHGGALRRGGKKGNKGGPGRVPSEVRAKCLGSFAKRIKVAEQIADSPTSSNADRLKALDLLAKYGGLLKVEHTGSDDAPLRFTLDMGTTLAGDE